MQEFIPNILPVKESHLLFFNYVPVQGLHPLEDMLYEGVSFKAKLHVDDDISLESFLLMSSLVFMSFLLQFLWGNGDSIPPVSVFHYIHDVHRANARIIIGYAQSPDAAGSANRGMFVHHIQWIFEIGKPTLQEQS